MKHDNPLKPGYDFNAHLVAGLTPIVKGGELDFLINRPSGMKGYIINMTVKGEGEIFHDDDVIYVKHGDMLLFPPNVAHYYQRKKNNHSWSHRWIYFRPRAYWNNWLSWEECQNGVYITKHLSEEKITEFEKLFEEVELVTKSDFPYRDELAVNVLERLLIECKSVQENFINKAHDSRVIDAMNYIVENLDKNFSLEDVSNHVYLSSSRLGHLFSKDVGMTISQWRDDQRVSRAKQMLVTTNYSINKISNKVGYKDSLYFSRVFKKVSGLSPKNYREK